VYFVKGAIQSFSNDLWKITINRNTGYRSFVPLDGNYTNVLIWFHDYNEDTKIAQSYFYDDVFYANKSNTKIAFIESPKRIMDYQILGQEVEDHAWFNMKTDFKN
jgi:hypothetical protein